MKNYHNMNMSKIKGNKLCTVKVTRDASYDLDHLFRKNLGARFLTLHDYKENEFLFSWESKPFFRANIIEVPNAHKPWLLTCTDEQYDKIKFKRLDIKRNIDGYILYPIFSE
tara:strand:+ start:176 stop:511 length:336 start_codon:yes stop_codon:yes gene_type:complete